MKMDNEAIRLPPSALMKGRTMKKICSLLLLLVFLFALVSCGKQDRDRQTASQIETVATLKGKTYGELSRLIGEEGTDVGFGACIMEWELSSGKYLHVWFTPQSMMAPMSDWIATGVALDDTHRLTPPQ